MRDLTVPLIFTDQVWLLPLYTANFLLAPNMHVEKRSPELSAPTHTRSDPIAKPVRLRTIGAMAAGNSPQQTLHNYDPLQILKRKKEGILFCISMTFV